MKPSGQRRPRLLLAGMLALAAVGGAAAQTPTLLVSAASSLTTALDALRPEAERVLGVSLLLNYGASGALRAQIEQGAPVDVFFSAAAADIDRLDKEGLLLPGSRRNLLANALVLVGDRSLSPPANSAALAKLFADARILSIGNPDSVPAGRYAVEALKSLDLYRLVASRLAFAGNVRDVLQQVESGAATLGIVFKTDALGLKPGAQARLLHEFPAGAVTTPIVYPVAVLAASRQGALALRLVEFLGSPFAAEIFRKAGFSSP